MEKIKNFVLAGNPNSGKTTLFNSLTGSTAHVGNWPGVTVDKKEGLYKDGDIKINIVDLPGIYSLSPYTPEEVISRNYILDEKPDCVINIVDVTNLERNLYLTTQLLEMDTPLIIALNMCDVLEKRGDKIDVKLLEKRIGVPVIEISALKEKNLKQLMNKALEASNKKRESFTILKNTKLAHLISDCEIAFKGKNVDNPLFHAIKLIENDEIETSNHPDLINMVKDYKKQNENNNFDDEFDAIIADERYKYITSEFSPTLYKNIKKDEDNNTLSNKIDKVLTNKWAGIPIFIAILFLIFHLVFSEDLFYLSAMGVKFNNNFEGTAFEGLFYSEGGINSLGIILSNFVNFLTGLITNLIDTSMMNNNNINVAITGFVVDGVLGGLFAVLGFLPQILLLFFFFSIMEDSGYMARVSFILDRIFRKLGLSGRAFIPMIMGFGCSVPAIINTRTLASDSERVATIRVIPFFSCGAKLPILTAVSGGLAASSFNLPFPELIVIALYILGMIVALVTILLMKYTTLKGDGAPFIMELPSYHLPQFKSLMLHLWDKCKHFIKKAFTIILLSTIFIWFLSSFKWDYTPLIKKEIIEETGDIVRITNSSESILAGIGMLIQPLFTPLGFGSQLTNLGWAFAVAAITGLIAKENVVASLGVLAGVFTGTTIDVEADGGISAMMIMIEETGISTFGAISFIAFNMLTIPCFAAVATARAELKKGTLKYTILFWLITSFIVSSIIYTVGEFIWPIAIWIAILIISILIIYLYNKYGNKLFKRLKR